MTTLTEKIWRPFFVGEIFDIFPGKRLTKAEMIAGDTPFIGASDSNNGVTAFVGNKNDSADENFLSVSYNGSVCECFYQPCRCLCSDDVKRFHLKNHAGNKYVYLFLANSIRQQKSKFNYGYKFNEARMRRQKIMLPVNDDGSPDFVFMENYVRAVEEKLLQRYRDFAQEKLSVLETKKIPPLNEKIWRTFRLLDYFDFIKGDQKDMTLLEKGDVPIVSAKNNNNGYKMFVDAEGQKIFKGNFLTINNNGDGGAGIAYYQPADVLLDNHVTALYPKIKMSRETMLFISRSITIQRSKFGYGYTLNNKRLKNFQVMLPVNDEGAPDFEYMEAYAKNLEAEKYRKYLAYIGDD